MTYTANVKEVQYRDTYANSDKFYRAYLLENEDDGDVRVLFQWGRNGSNGQCQVVTQATVRGAEEAVRAKLESKLKKGYQESASRQLKVVPDDLLALAGVNENARSQAAAKLSADPFARVEADLDVLIRSFAGSAPGQIAPAAIVMRRDLNASMQALRDRLTAVEGSLELVDDVLQAKLGA